jgi:sigma-B regulation protein RsbU (phosphoserine phosphatase)
MNVQPLANQELSDVDRIAVRSSLVDRRQRLGEVHRRGAAAVAGLLVAVDAALDRLETGLYGACERCDGRVEPDRLLADPLATVCLDCLSDAERDALQRDLELASRVQATLLPPRDFGSTAWRGHYEYRPHGTVGGDYVDVITPGGDDGDLIVLLGDVSGKGVAAAMLMSHLHAGMRALATTGCSLGELLGRSNRLLYGASAPNLYATLAALCLKPDGRADIVTAGHPPVIVLGRDGARVIGTRGLPIGMFGEATYHTATVQLAQGESLLLYTDGVSESLDPDGDELGVDRLAREVARHAERTPEELVDAAVAIAARHRGTSPAHDDLTVAAVRRT